MTTHAESVQQDVKRDPWELWREESAPKTATQFPRSAKGDVTETSPLHGTTRP